MQTKKQLHKVLLRDLQVTKKQLFNVRLTNRDHPSDVLPSQRPDSAHDQAYAPRWDLHQVRLYHLLRPSPNTILSNP